MFQVFVPHKALQILQAIYLLLFFKDNIIKSSIDCLPATVDSFLINTAATAKQQKKKGVGNIQTFTYFFSPQEIKSGLWNAKG